MVDTTSGEVIMTTSVHHQMMIPSAGAKIVAHCPNPYSKSKERMGSEGSRTVIIHRQAFTPEPDIEALWYPEHAAFCIQGHPEYVRKDNRLARYYMENISKFFNFKISGIN